MSETSFATDEAAAETAAAALLPIPEEGLQAGKKSGGARGGRGRLSYSQLGRKSSGWTDVTQQLREASQGMKVFIFFFFLLHGGF